MIPFHALLTIASVLVTLSVGAQTPTIVRVEMSEFAFQPATISLTAGRPVRLVLVNRGRIAHQFETLYLRTRSMQIVGDMMFIETAGFDFVRLDPGGTARLGFLPRDKGRFVFACTIEGHKEAGMQGVLEVR